MRPRYLIPLCSVAVAVDFAVLCFFFAFILLQKKKYIFFKAHTHTQTNTFNACWHDEAKFACFFIRCSFSFCRPNMVRWMNSVCHSCIDHERKTIFYRKVFAMLLPHCYNNIVLKHVYLVLYFFFARVYFTETCVEGVFVCQTDLSVVFLFLPKFFFSIFLFCFVSLCIFFVFVRMMMANFAHDMEKPENLEQHLCRVNCKNFLLFSS